MWVRELWERPSLCARSPGSKELPRSRESKRALPTHSSEHASLPTVPSSLSHVPCC